MWSKSIFISTSLAIALFTCATTVHAATDSILIVYPKPGQTLTVSDSSFVLGSVPKSILLPKRELIVRINGTPFPVHPEGGFIGFVALKPGDFSFEITAHEKVPIQKKKHTSVLAKGSVAVKVPKPYRTISPDTLRITGDYRPPRGNIVAAAGDRIDISFQGTPGGKAWFAIPGVADSIPMTERPPETQGYWGDALFGEGKDTDSIVPEGVYSGYFVVKEATRADSLQIRYYLQSPFVKVADASQQVPKKKNLVTDTSDYRVSFNSPTFPFSVRVKDSIIVIRHGIMQGYMATFQPRGLELLVVGAEGDWYKVRLSQTQFGWVNSAQTERLPSGVLPPKTFIKSIRQFSFKDSVVFRTPVNGMHPFRTIEDDRTHLRIQLFGVNSDTDWIRYDNSDSLVDFARWYQPEQDLYELSISMREPIWGYDCYFSNGNFCIAIIRPPKDLGILKGKRIVLDPGHSKDPGSTGPTGYTEAEANLAIAVEVRNSLVAKGAQVIMTRPDMRDVPLADRAVIAKANHADLFVSIHNNALPDGVNPFGKFGTACFYYNVHSLDLARAIHQKMLVETGLSDYGVYYGNLAVIRPTECPAVLVECAFMMLPDQESLIKTDKFRKQVAKAITEGVEQFCKEFDHGR